MEEPIDEKYMRLRFDIDRLQQFGAEAAWITPDRPVTSSSTDDLNMREFSMAIEEDFDIDFPGSNGKQNRLLLSSRARFTRS